MAKSRHDMMRLSTWLLLVLALPSITPTPSTGHPSRNLLMTVSSPRRPSSRTAIGRRVAHLMTTVDELIRNQQICSGRTEEEATLAGLVKDAKKLRANGVGRKLIKDAVFKALKYSSPDTVGSFAIDEGSNNLPNDWFDTGAPAFQMAPPETIDETSDANDVFKNIKGLLLKAKSNPTKQDRGSYIHKGNSKLEALEVLTERGGNKEVERTSLERNLKAGKSNNGKQRKKMQDVALPAHIPFFPPEGLTLVVNSGQRPAIREEVAYMSDKSVYDVINEAAISASDDVSGDEDSDLFECQTRAASDSSQRCHVLAQCGRFVADNNHYWMISVQNKEGQVLFESRCLPSAKEFTLRPANIIKLQYTTTEL